MHDILGQIVSLHAVTASLARPLSRCHRVGFIHAGEGSFSSDTATDNNNTNAFWGVGGGCGVDVLLTTQCAAHAHRLRCHCPCSTCIAIALLEQCASEFLCLNRHRLAQNASLRVNGCVRRSSIAWHVMPRFEPMAAHTAAASPGTKCLASHQ